MPKKIYDILPPTIANKVEDTIKALDPKPKKKSRRPKQDLEQKKELPKKAKRRFPMREILIGGVVVVFLIGIYLGGKLAKADIIISPKLDTVTLQDAIVADTSADAVDMQKKIIPLKLLEETKEGSQEFPATGITSNDGKATGTITIYNKLSPATPLTLISGTHFLSDSGKYFVTLAKVTIPAMKGKTPGSINVKVQAKEVGAEYNIKPSKFSVPKLSGTTYYYGIWGESKESMTGGYTGKVKKVTKDDLNSAEDVLTEKLLHDAGETLKTRIAEDEVLLGDIVSKVIETGSEVKAETIIDAFNQSAKVKVSALVLKKGDLEKFANDKISSQLAEDKRLLDGSFRVEYSQNSIDFSKGIGRINIQASAKTYYAMDVNDLADLFKRKSSSEIKEIIDSQYGEKVSKTQVIFWPFWVKSAPKDINKINIVLNFK